MQLCLTKLSVILEIDPYLISLDFFLWKNYRSVFKFLRQRIILYYREKKDRIYANFKYLDRNVRWVLSTLAGYIYHKSRFWMIFTPTNLQQSQDDIDFSFFFPHLIHILWFQFLHFLQNCLSFFINAKFIESILK